MATRDDVLDAIHRIEAAAGAGPATRTAQAALSLPLPESGYDRVLSQLRLEYPRTLAPVYPAPAAAAEQLGRAAQAMKDAEAALRQQLSASARFDRQVIEALRHAHQTTVEGRRRLDNLEAEITDAARAWDLSTAAGAREFQRLLVAKLGEIIRVVEETNDDDTSKQALAAALRTLYAAQSDSAEPENPEPSSGPADGAVPPPVAAPIVDDPYLDALPVDELAPGYPDAIPPPSGAPSMPAVPGLGGESPGFGAMPPAMPAGLPLAGLRSESPDGDAPGDEYLFDDMAPLDDAASDDSDGGEADDETAPDPSPDNGPATVRLPDGATTTVADAQLAAAMQAVADGTPVADAFQRQGIDIPPPGTPVAAPVDLDRLRPGDIGTFTDRHALAVGDGKALLDGQIHLAANLRGPGFLGWQHLPVRSSDPGPLAEPVPTRTAGALRA